MYILHRVEYPDRSIPVSQVQNAWTSAGLPQPVPAMESTSAGPEEIQRIVTATLTTVGATVSKGNGSSEVPRSAGDVLRRLEDFYHRLYPETRDSGHRGHFQFEEVEWLGEF